MIAQENIISEQLIDREFNHIYLYESGYELDQYRIQTEEISGLFFISVTEFRELVSGEADLVLVEGLVHDESTGRMVHSHRTVRLSDLTTNSNDYYNLLFKKLDDLIMAEDRLESVGDKGV